MKPSLIMADFVDRHWTGNKLAIVFRSQEKDTKFRIDRDKETLRRNILQESDHETKM